MSGTSQNSERITCDLGVLWVGVIKDIQHIEITPEGSFRPCTHQYLIKPEAIDSTAPVCNSLLQAGVTVPCNRSPVRTPIFPVKKRCDQGPTRTREKDVKERCERSKSSKRRGAATRFLPTKPYTLLSRIKLNGSQWSIPAAPFPVCRLTKATSVLVCIVVQRQTDTWTRWPRAESPTVYKMGISTYISIYMFR